MLLLQKYDIFSNLANFFKLNYTFHLQKNEVNSIAMLLLCTKKRDEGPYALFVLPIAYMRPFIPSHIYPFITIYLLSASASVRS